MCSQPPSSHPVITLKQSRDGAVRRRHPWVFSGAIAQKQGAVSNGCFVEVRAHDGTVLGAGHWGTRSIAVRMLSFGATLTEEQIIRERLGAAADVRRTLGLLENDATNGYRLVHAEGDGLCGLVIDIYGEVGVVQCHSAGMWRLREVVANTLRSGIVPGLKDVVFRRVEAQIGGGDGDGEEGEESAPIQDSGSTDGAKLVPFRENGLHFVADLTGGQKTGFFLDQRNNRLRVKEYARGRRVLNAFCYSGAFSVYALAGGAESVVSVDASRSALDLCQQNVERNFPGAQHVAEAADCFSYLTQIPDTYNLIILDPPAFAKHQRALQRALRGYETINAAAFRKIQSGGVLFTFSCSQLVSVELFREAVMRAAVQAGRFVRIIDVLHQAPCHPTSVFHPEGEYLKGLVLVVE